ncbi:MAG: molybdopterin dinucleotide binding domain-containing protein [Planctomycetaceae bacterium]
MPEAFILIPGRTSRQGTSLNEGKYTDGYQDEIRTLKMNPDDMRRLGISDGGRVRMWNDVGSVVVPCESGKQELPPGLLFISYGDISSRLMGGETHGSGMPDSKGLDVFVEKAGERNRP